MYLISSKNLICYLIQAIDILKLTENLPHVTRGSCGSSLVCYLLGISHIDPVKYNIKFARFLNEYRNNLPDIDLDFPHNVREEVFLKIQLKWPNKVARISNHVHFHEKSAVRQALRNSGIRKFIGKNDINKEINQLSSEQRQFVMDEKKRLDNTFRCYSLHCGGIVYFSDGIPEDLIINKNKKNLLQQIILDKRDIAKEKNFKIDILSSRALSQCYEINNFNVIDFEDFIYDKKTFEMLHNGDNIGIILGESPLIRKAFIKMKPKNIFELAICLSIIRPAAKDARQVDVTSDFGELNDNIIFDDDAIDMIAKDFKISDAEADRYRRGFTKGSKEVISEFRNLTSHLSKEEQKNIEKSFKETLKQKTKHIKIQEKVNSVYESSDLFDDNGSEIIGRDRRVIINKLNQYRNLFPKELSKFKVEKGASTQELQAYLDEMATIVETSSYDNF